MLSRQPFTGRHNRPADYKVKALALTGEGKLVMIAENNSRVTPYTERPAVVRFILLSVTRHR